MWVFVFVPVQIHMIYRDTLYYIWYIYIYIPKDHWTLKTGYFGGPYPRYTGSNPSIGGSKILRDILILYQLFPLCFFISHGPRTVIQLRKVFSSKVCSDNRWKTPFQEFKDLLQEANGRPIILDFYSILVTKDDDLVEKVDKLMRMNQLIRRVFFMISSWWDVCWWWFWQISMSQGLILFGHFIVDIDNVLSESSRTPNEFRAQPQQFEYVDDFATLLNCHMCTWGYVSVIDTPVFWQEDTFDIILINFAWINVRYVMWSLPHDCACLSQNFQRFCGARHTFARPPVGPVVTCLFVAWLP